MQKKKINLSGMVIGPVLALVLMSGITLAQTPTNNTTTASTDISPKLVQLAQDLGCQNNAECAQKFDANIEQGITLAQKYNVYTPEQNKVAGAFKTEVLEQLRAVSGDNFEGAILALANKILKEKPALAKTMGVTGETVASAQTIINTVKEAGVDIQTCQKSPEDLSRAELIACVKASNNLSSKGKLAGDYIPKDNVKGGEAEQMLALEKSLLAGEYSGLGKVSVEEAGQVCLKPGSESITNCDQIAQKFFGTDGVKQLQDARQQTTRIKEYYAEGINRMELVTPDGQKLIGKGAIKNACNRAFEENNLGLARACGNFAVKNGYTTQEEIENGLKLLETFSQKAQGVNFDDCRFNPESCKEFLSPEFRGEFNSQSEIFKVMSESIGFDPARCENTYDSDIGKRCLEGAKKALGRIEEIAKNSPEARKIVNEIKSHISEGERMTQKLDAFNQDSSRGGVGGPGGCKGPEECFKYCNQPANSAECISFGAKSQIFDQNTIVQKFTNVNDKLNAPYPGFAEPGKGFDYVPYPNQPDQRFNQYPQYPYPPQQPVGPSPECFAAISSGDYVKAKTACSSTTVNYPRPTVEPYPVCPAYAMASPCPEGQMRQAASDGRGCPTYGACVAIENYKPTDTTYKSCPSGQYWNGSSCIAQPTTQCPSGQWWDGATQSCRSSTTDTYKQCDWSIDYLKMSSNTCVARSTCYISTNPDYNSSECQGVRGSTTPIPTVGSCNYSTQYWKPSTSQCLPRTNCSDTANSEYNSQECQGVRGSTTVSYGCGSFTAQSACQASPGCGWANGACGGNAITNNSCPAGQYWNGTSCINSSDSSCPSNITTLFGSDCHSMSGGYFNGPMDKYVLFNSTTVTNCSTSPVSGCSGSNTTTGSGTCPSGYHYHSESGGFCMNSQENYSGTCYNSAGTATMTCPQTTYTNSCPSGQYWNGSSCVNSTTSGGTCGSPSSQTQSACMAISGCNWFNNACSTSGTPGSSCTSGQYWNGTACVANSTTSTDPSTGCAQAGGTWNPSTSFCQMPSTTSSCPSGWYWNGSSCVSSTSASTCPSGQYWNGTSCVSSSATSGASSCTSGQYWNGTSCVTSYTPPPTDTYAPAPTYTPPPSTYTPPPTDTYAPAPTYTPPPSTYTPPPAYTPPPSAMILCSQSGGNWTGTACNLAENITSQKAYYNYYQRPSDALLAQVIKAFANLFR